MSNPIQSHDLYQPGPQDELKLLHARLAQLQLDIKNMTVLARSLKTALGGLNINTGNTRKQIIDIATKSEKLKQQNERTCLLYTSTADLDRGWKQYFGFSVDVCYVTNYNSDPTTIPTPIIAAQVATS